MFGILAITGVSVTLPDIKPRAPIILRSDMSLEASDICVTGSSQ